MNVLKLLYTASVALALSACSFDKNSSSDSKVNAENYAYLKGKYLQITGTYGGTLTLRNGASASGIELALTTVDVASGTNSRGQTLLIPALVARIGLSADQDVILNKVDYRDDTVPPEILMTSSAGELTNPQNMTARFEVQGTDLVGTVSRSGRLIGNARLALLSRESTGPAEGDQEAANERVRRALAPVVGSYEGQVVPPRGSGNTEPFFITIDVSISSKPDSRFPAENRQIPTLIGIFKRRNNIPGNLGTRLAISYLPDGNPQKLSMVTDGSVQNANPEQISIMATFDSGTIEGTFIGYDNQSYPMTLKRTVR